MELSNRRVMVVGLGLSGRAAARLLAARGARLLMTDRAPGVPLEGLPAGELRLGGEDPAWLENIELLVASPGVPRDSVLLRTAVNARIPVIGELELAARFIDADAPMIAITGTNGKSTVTTLVGEMLKAGGRRTFVGGNLGLPLSRAAGEKYDALAVEVSSYQLEWIDRFRPHIGVHLNLSADHLDRYRDLDEYGRAKAALFRNQDASDFAVLNRGDPRVIRLAGEVKSRVIGFGLAAPRRSGPRQAWKLWRNLWMEGREIVYGAAERGEMRIALGGFSLLGRHNLENAMAAAGAALAAGAEPEAIARALDEFKGLAHRLETVHRARGVTFVDDSKGTNVGAVVEALAAFEGPTILLAGGVDKGGSYAPLLAPLREKVKLLVLYGAARGRMSAALGGAVRTEVVETLAQAVAAAARAARSGDLVMLSPACASFDQFKDYVERGNLFQKLVRAL